METNLSTSFDFSTLRLAQAQSTEAFRVQLKTVFSGPMAEHRRLDLRCSEILPARLYLGDMTAALNESIMSQFKITHILNASNRAAPNKWESNEEGHHHSQYFNVDIDDNEETDISSFFEPATKWISSALAESSDNVVFVHCMCGVSRWVA